MTEAANYLAHGTSPIGVGFAMGGTIVNMLAIYGYIPSRKLLSVFYTNLRTSPAGQTT
jgi:hypothetical protein